MACFFSQQAIVKLCIRKKKNKTLQLQSVFTRGPDLNLEWILVADVKFYPPVFLYTAWWCLVEYENMYM